VGINLPTDPCEPAAWVAPVALGEGAEQHQGGAGMPRVDQFAHLGALRRPEAQVEHRPLDQPADRAIVARARDSTGCSMAPPPAGARRRRAARRKVRIRVRACVASLGHAAPLHRPAADPWWTALAGAAMQIARDLYAILGAVPPQGGEAAEARRVLGQRGAAPDEVEQAAGVLLARSYRPCDRGRCGLRAVPEAKEICIFPVDACRWRWIPLARWRYLCAA
jgi:hypothetical protein